MISALLIAGAAGAQGAREEPRIGASDLRAHVAFLADDLLEGRNAGTRGYDIAAAYVASRFDAMGLRAAGSQQGWYQTVPMREADGTGTRRVTLIGRDGERSWTHGEDVVIRPGLISSQQVVEAPLVFVGYGIDSPDRGIEDYAGLDVRGAIVVTLSGYPRGMPSDVGAHLNAEKSMMAQAHGAIGVVTIATDAFDTVFPWDRYVGFADEPVTSWVQDDGVPFSRAPGIRASAFLNRPVAEILFTGTGRSLAGIRAEAARQGGVPRGFALGRSIRIESGSSFRDFRSANIVGVLPGSDPALANEYVLMTAHLDHDGIREDAAVNGDAVFNGAMDNAMGVATMLEVARALAESPDRPRRPIMFVALTGEEDGLLGADYLARHPQTGRGEVVAVVNVDTPVMTYAFIDIVAYGGENSTLGAAAAAAAARSRLTVSPDPMPDEGIFTRSDHYSWVLQGVPAVFVATGPGGPGAQAWADYLGNHYHRADDDIGLPFDWNSSARFAQLNRDMVRAIANAAERPLWYEGNFFGNTFAPRAPRAPAATAPNAAATR